MGDGEGGKGLSPLRVCTVTLSPAATLGILLFSSPGEWK